MLFTRRPAIVLTLFAACVLAITPPVSAGCLCDWLFGKPTTYAAAVPVTPAPAYSATMPVTPAYSAAMPVTTYPAQTSFALPAATPAPQYAAQMPAYGSVPPLPTGYAGQYSSLYGGGAPQVTTPAAVPAVTAAPITSYYGTGNVYPSVQTTSGYTANYMALQPVTTVRSGGLFSRLFGTNYRTSYYRAPVTYYRPQTTIDPVSGTTVTVQRPCTAYQYQVQRAPYLGLQPAPATPAGNCATGGCTTAAPYAPIVTSPATVPYTQSAPLGSNGAVSPSSEGFVPQPTLPPAGLDPYAAQRATSSYSATPSYTPSNGYTSSNGYPSSNGYTATPLPLTGAPSTAPAPSSSSASGDYAPVAPPAMESQRIPQADDSNGPRYWPAPPTGSVPDPPSTYARPIPAPAATWSQPSTAAPATEPTTGRTASRPAWGFKKISWNAADAGGVQQAGYQDGQVQAAADSSAEWLQLNAPQQAIDAMPTRPQTQAYPTPAPQPAERSRSEYDNSGWRAAR